MNLPKKDVDLFCNLYHPLLFYVNTKFGILDIDAPEEIRGTPLEEVRKLTDKLYEHPELINEFIKENPYNFNSSELQIVKEWIYFAKGEFILFRHLKKYTIFLDLKEPPKAYGVLALYSPFDEVILPPPVMVQAVLLPFKGKIIYDGILSSYSIFFGSGYRKSLNDAYQEAKFRFGIIESLPFIEEEKKNDEDKLRFYLKSERNRDMYWDEIMELIKNPRLLKVYHQEIGKISSRRIKKMLRDAGLLRGWFAVLDELVIASGVTKDDARNVIQDIVPEEKWEFVYYFQLK